jgi:hypothetical protein
MAQTAQQVLVDVVCELVSFRRFCVFAGGSQRSRRRHAYMYVARAILRVSHGCLFTILANWDAPVLPGATLPRLPEGNCNRGRRLNVSQ